MNAGNEITLRSLSSHFHTHSLTHSLTSPFTYSLIHSALCALLDGYHGMTDKHKQQLHVQNSCPMSIFSLSLSLLLAHSLHSALFCLSPLLSFFLFLLVIRGPASPPRAQTATSQERLDESPEKEGGKEGEKKEEISFANHVTGRPMTFSHALPAAHLPLSFRSLFSLFALFTS